MAGVAPGPRRPAADQVLSRPIPRGVSTMPDLIHLVVIVAVFALLGLVARGVSRL
ncbi:hypothetical protein ABZ707_28840 [Streptomyces sp. NPDC006923]|uniref:hypothetical protein n=1 Tax=Streptomyces sp. NPDC006923 TaxID=3155355 RepID=UPI0033C31895